MKVFVVKLTLFAVIACLFIPAMNWGLPRDDVNAYLFGTHSVWSGKQIMELAGSTEDANRGADVASHAPEAHDHPAIVNATDVERARIVRRYRLMSYQPDEWNTLKSLAEMKPGQGNFDPKLYQYGGLWVYPVGALLKFASMVHLIELRSDMAWYLDHPSQFGRFYVVARCWSMVWALVGAWAVYALVRRITEGQFFPLVATVAFILLPVVVNMSFEAKPHLAGAALTLLAVLAASKYVESGSLRWGLTAGALCGAALGMVLSTLTVFLILPAMVFLRRPAVNSTSAGAVHKIRLALAACLLGLVVYGITNPYIPINFVRNRAILVSNLGNSKAMYHPELSAEGLANAAYLVAAGASPLLAAVGLIGAILLGGRALKMRQSGDPAEIRRRATGLLLAIPGLCVLGQSLLVARGKPGEFGRFMLMGDVFLLVEAFVFLATLKQIPFRIRTTLTFLLTATTALAGSSYLRAFWSDCQPVTSRMALARQIQMDLSESNHRLNVYADPAPYCLPPANVFDVSIVLLPDVAAPLASGQMSVSSVDREGGDESTWKHWLGLYVSTPISWANKPMTVRRQ